MNRGAALDTQRNSLSEHALGLDSWDYGWVFFLSFGFVQIFFCNLNKMEKKI
jgi:hypothetical protein